MAMMTEPEIEAAIREISKKSIGDATFRALALRDGRAAISAVGTGTLPEFLDFRFVDNSTNVKTVPLPDPIAASDELSEAELEQVAGGCLLLSCLNTGKVAEVS